MPTIFIDNKPYEVSEGQNVLHAAVAHGLNLPYFCWHPALGSAGACRQCAVQHYKDEQDTQGRLVMSCMTPATEGSRFSIEHPTCKSFRSDVIEWMMTNHPHDCPVCDEGGECHLQDMTVMTGHNQRKYRFKKRTFKNQHLGPYINHEMNRCITCYRCVRYYRDVAGGEDLHAFSSANHVYFGRFEDGQLESEFSGNLVEVCPTGVFTDKTFRAHYTRKWDLQTAPSICQNCSLGCNISPGERLGSLRRVQNRFHPDINGYFLCDRGRFEHRFVNDANQVPLHANIVGLKTDKHLVGIGSPKASLEANFALRQLVGAEHFYDGHTEEQHTKLSHVMRILSEYPSTASLQDVRLADCLVVLGEDVSKTAPMLALSIRQNLYTQAQRQAASKGIPEWNDIAVRNAERDTPDCLYVACEAPTQLDKLAYRLGQFDWLPRLQAAKNPVIISGTSASESDLSLMADLKRQVPQAKLCFVLPAANSLGLMLLKAKPLNSLPHNQPHAVVLENDLPETIRRKFSKLIAIDFLQNDTTQAADVALGCASFAETTGTLVNNEGRAQRYYAVFERQKKRPESWRVLRDLSEANWQNIDELCAEISREFPVFEAFFKQVHGAQFKIHGEKIARQTPEFSGRTSINAHLGMHEQAPHPDPDSPLAYSMEGYHGDMPPDLASSYWRPGWNSVQSFHALSHASSGVKLLG